MPRLALCSRFSILCLCLCLCIALLLPGCGPAGDSSPATTADQIKVAVSVLPQAAFVRRIGGEHVDVQTFVAQGQDPHHFSTTPKQVVSLAGASAFFTVGMPFEQQLVAKITGAVPGMKIIDVAGGIEHEENETDGEHGEEDHAGEEEETGGHGGHHHGFDPHVWLSPPEILVQAENIHRALVAIDPAHKEAYDANLGAFLAEVTALHQKLTRQLAPYKGRAFFVYHPAFTHFAEAYGLEQVAIEVDGKNPTPKQIIALVERAKALGAKVIFVQPQFDPSGAQTVAGAIGGIVTPIDPLAEDVLANLDAIATALVDGFSMSTTPQPQP